MKKSNIIPQCVEAYKTNITGYGHALEFLPGQSDDTAKAEWDIADIFMQTANLEESIEQLLSQLVEDLEHCGNAYIEVARGGGLPAIYRIPPEYMRCTAPLEKVEMRYQRLVHGKAEEFTQSKWVRRYAQKRGVSITWFREFGAPGEENEVIHLQLGNGTYGEPRWSGNSPGVIGSRKVGKLNLDYFDNGRMLAMILTVMNGELAPQSIEALKGAKGKKSQGGILYLEVQGYDKGTFGDEKEKTSIKLDKLNDLLQQDALFLEYNREKRKETRSAVDALSSKNKLGPNEPVTEYDINRWEQGIADAHAQISVLTADGSNLKTRMNTLESTLPDGFIRNNFNDDLATVDSIKVIRGYYNEAQSRMEV
ncbi:hypothetical protein P4V54_20240 [Brevibacillus nitrificans]|uniref:hypothetical protein n=1 Tax=Brevibacillus nitrificans TaxID=651560 RepID=UPI002E1A30E5|nr:hypothetical protein [Brevibacillus nitrificans]